MAARRQTKATFLVILGLLVIEFGLLLALHQTTLLDPFIELVNDLQAIELLGISMMFIGGILIVISVMGLAYGIVAGPIQDEMQTLENRISMLQETMREEISQASVRTEVQSCKFCGKPIKKDAVFCPACGKAQT